MKTSVKIVGTILPLALMAATGCSTMKGGKSGEDLAATGPTVLDVRTNPGTFELNNNLQSNKPAEVLADVKDFTGNITDVRLRFLRAPLEVPMQHVSGTTWRAQLTPEQLKLLAVSGQTMKYEANVIARNDDGKIAVSQSPVTVAIKAPEVGQPVG